MKKLTLLIASLCLIVLFAISASAANLVTIVNITVTEPKVGASPDYKATLPATASTEIISTS